MTLYLTVYSYEYNGKKYGYRLGANEEPVMFPGNEPLFTLSTDPPDEEHLKSQAREEAARRGIGPIAGL